MNSIVSHPLEQGPEGWLFFQMRGALAEYEPAKTLERLKRGLVGRAKAAHVSGGTVAFGYRYIKTDHGDDGKSTKMKRPWCVASFAS
jgi:DNA invertase Pin-like site-specific DNA recombinase